MEYLREMSVMIDFIIDQSALTQTQREMANVNKESRQMASEASKMERAHRSAYRDMRNETSSYNQELVRQSILMRELAHSTGMSASELGRDWSYMSQEMQHSLLQNHMEMMKHRQDLVGVEDNMRRLGNQMGNYQGSTQDFMSELQKLGKEHKKITDNMINYNLALRHSFVESLATMSAMSTTSEKISKNYDRMGNAMYLVNKPLLAVTDRLERMARAGSAAQLALEILGPNAGMKELQRPK